ncbi:hypothetical protein [Alcanivorax jadensis]|uniref:hypothetical protein n=1 Tax=Alcanivorax jadensis TaxID=64988 RepID=UPI00235531C1|nr:hypothetical protein [Alcanivorax jadensis]|tara:strand:- start:13973 stop:14767 length:795 start_codon:yes stop_codon:yes gene_type:complete
MSHSIVASMLPFQGTGRPGAKLLHAFATLIVGVCLHANPVYALEALDDDEMDAVTGQAGILLSFQYYFNSNQTDNPGTPDFNEAGARLTGATGCSTPNGGASLGNMNCRFAMQLKNRESEWLVFKNGHASIDLRRLSLDASVLGDSHGAGAAYNSFFNAEKFQEVDGTCLLPSGDCSSAGASGLANMAGLRLSYPEGNADGEEFNDARFGLYFEGLAVEPNSSALVQDGWSRNINGSFMGLNIADNNGHQAGIAFGGDFYLYGF